MEFADGGDMLNSIITHKKIAKYFAEKDIWKFFLQV
jgi:hypothetical protein